jgi:hypothetical protein
MIALKPVMAGNFSKLSKLSHVLSKQMEFC